MSTVVVHATAARTSRNAATTAKMTTDAMHTDANVKPRTTLSLAPYMNISDHTYALSSKPASSTMSSYLPRTRFAAIVSSSMRW